uniref:TrmE-type G domain-containing protein n=1 Tax=Strigamia maritima TaxID=126957 RepID=T1IWS7_STRMM
MKLRAICHQFRCLNTRTNTIFALASGRGKCAVSIFRVSGPDASLALTKMCKYKILPHPREANLRRIFDPETNQLLDKGLVLWFAKPNSFTGEDSCEFHIHGGLAVQTALFNALAKLPQFRPAEAGEFTKRAFYNSKLDLTQMEGLADVISAETEAQRKQAVLQMDGVLAKRYESWSKRLLECLARLEAFIDFGEDENIEESIVNKVLQDVDELKHEIDSHLNDNRRGERLRSGIRIAIIGEPNSTGQRPIAIVSSSPGTTRDVIEAAYDVAGYPVIFSDTAGLRVTDDSIEREGVRRARMIAKRADVIIFVITLDSTDISTISARDIDRSVADLHRQFDIKSEIALNSLIAINKIDLFENSIHFDDSSQRVVPISCLTGQNLTKFVQTLKNTVENMQVKLNYYYYYYYYYYLFGSSKDEAPLTKQRHRQNLVNSSTALEKCLKMHKLDIVLAAENLRQSVRHLAKITGKVTPEDVLDVIFKEFCIGK